MLPIWRGCGRSAASRTKTTAGSAPAQSWAEAAGEYHKERGNRPSLVEYKPAELARLRALLRREVTLDRAKAEIQAHHERQRNAADLDRRGADV